MAAAGSAFEILDQLSNGGATLLDVDTRKFQPLPGSVRDFIKNQENTNTRKKTNHDVALLHEFLC